MHDVQRFAIAGIAIDQYGQICRANDLPDEERDLVDRDDAEIGRPIDSVIAAPDR